MGQEESSLVSDGEPPVTLTERSLSSVAEYIKSGQAKRIIVMTGAGISTAAGIPDFRSPGTGLYANLARLNLPHAEAVFDISYFREKPEPFYVLARELYPGKFHPTISHAFIALLAKKDMLRMLFTQNIDCLERAAGVPADQIVEAHGSFATQRCIECKKEYPDGKMKEHVLAGEVPHCEGCDGLVKPDIVFFGEALPKAFGNNAYQANIADLVLVIGTSLSVYPFASLPGMVPKDKPRVLFNMERVGDIGTRPDDVLVLGKCDDGIRRLADELGWREELENLWVDIVGKKEVARQKAASKRLEEEVEDEVAKLAEGVESVLNFEETSEKAEVVKHAAAVSARDTRPEESGSRPELAESMKTKAGDKRNDDQESPVDSANSSPSTSTKTTPPQESDNTKTESAEVSTKSVSEAEKAVL